MKTDDICKTTYDICIAGSGPAGIIFSLEYTRLNPQHKVLLLEYGDKKTAAENELDNSIKIENPAYHFNPYECTNKGLGGTSHSWGGRCVMWDEVDFMDRPVLKGGCTWDLSLFREINRYLPVAASYFECGEPVFNLNELAGIKKNRIAENFTEGIVTDSVLERWSKPTRFGIRYGKDIAERANLTLLEGVEARDFSAPDKTGKVSSLIIREVDTRKTFEIKAENFVIAAGAQETTRILLRNRQLFKNLPAVPYSLGRYYQGHLCGKIASVQFTGDAKKTDYGFIRDTDGTYLRRRFQFSSDFLVSNNLLNTAIWLDNPLYHDPGHHNGAMSFMYLAMITPGLGKKLAPPAIAHTLTQGNTGGVPKHIWNVMHDLPHSVTTPATIFYKRYLKERKLPGVFLFNPDNYYSLHFHAEQTADADNRMELGADRETLIIHYSPKDADIHSVIQLHEVLDRWLRKCGCGELKYWYPRKELADVIRLLSKDGVHQSGTTRIASTPDKGVVDTDLKLWGVSNIFINSSSVFPTSGQANPTFLLGAFASRLACHLTKKRN